MPKTTTFKGHREGRSKGSGKGRARGGRANHKHSSRPNGPRDPAGGSNEENADTTPDRKIDGSKPEDFVFFWQTEQEHGWACQWHDEPFKGPARLEDEPPLPNGESEEQTFPTAEHFMMYHKALIFGDIETAKAMLEATTPNKVRSLGRQVSGFDQEIWDQKRYDVVLQGSFAKFRSSTSILHKLMATDDKILVEASPYDKIWGIGFNKENAFRNKDHWGLNLLGKILMEVRETFWRDGYEYPGDEGGGE